MTRQKYLKDPRRPMGQAVSIAGDIAFMCTNCTHMQTFIAHTGWRMQLYRRRKCYHMGVVRHDT